MSSLICTFNGRIKRIILPFLCTVLSLSVSETNSQLLSQQNNFILSVSSNKNEVLLFSNMSHPAAHNQVSPPHSKLSFHLQIHTFYMQTSNRETLHPVLLIFNRLACLCCGQIIGNSTQLTSRKWRLHMVLSIK